ncbi:hypothetical protein QZH41_017992, partial [Actinostola sp. cb2023]
MDNVVTGADCEEKAIEYYTLSRNYLQQAGMNLRQWVSNSSSLNTKAAGAQELETLKNKILATSASQRFLANNGIAWKFITARAPWWGGFYERLVGMTKRCLKKTIGKASLNVIELYTVLTEVEAVLNSRPLTYPYVEINDDPPLTPSHFLCGHRLLTLPDSNGQGREIDPEYNPSETSAKDLNKRAKYHEYVIQAFWRRWQQEYLTGLREQHSKLHRSPGNAATVNIGDV